MNSFVSALEERFNYKFTENGAVALESTGSKVYDLFAFGAAYRNRSIEDCLLLFKQAYEEDPTLALKCLFYIRDCRGGQGERRFFRACFHWLAYSYPTVAADLIQYLPEYGRYDDLFVCFKTPIEKNMLELITNQLTLDMECVVDEKQGVSLLAKWMPSENAHSIEAKIRASKIRDYIGMTPKQYRQMLSKLRERINVLERLMSANRWDEIEFDKIPSKAGLVYRNAFARRDIIAKRYEEFIKSDETKVNAETLYPYEVVRKAIDCSRKLVGGVERVAINKYWINLPDYLNGEPLSMMCVVDTSGSMTWGSANNIKPIDVAISLGMYTAERMGGPFHNKYISFSSRPQLINIKGVDFVDKVKRIYDANLCDNTNLPAVFDLLFDIVIKNPAAEKDMPKTIVVISDMEIDSATYMKYGSRLTKGTINTTMESIRNYWKAYGLELPKLVYRNVNARNDTILDAGPNISFVSGCSPSIFKQVLTGKTGVELMMEVLMSERYAPIKM